MSDEFGSDYITVTDEDGNEYELELLDSIEFEGSSYTVFLPADIDTMSADDPDYGFIFLKNIVEDGEEILATVDDEDELNRVYEYYMSLMEEEEERELEEEAEKADGEKED